MKSELPVFLFVMTLLGMGACTVVEESRVELVDPAPLDASDRVQTRVYVFPLDEGAICTRLSQWLDRGCDGAPCVEGSFDTWLDAELSGAPDADRYTLTTGVEGRVSLPASSFSVIAHVRYESDALDAALGTAIDAYGCASGTADGASRGETPLFLAAPSCRAVELCRARYHAQCRVEPGECAETAAGLSQLDQVSCAPAGSSGEPVPSEGELRAMLDARGLEQIAFEDVQDERLCPEPLAVRGSVRLNDEAREFGVCPGERTTDLAPMHVTRRGLCTAAPSCDPDQPEGATLDTFDPANSVPRTRCCEPDISSTDQQRTRFVNSGEGAWMCEEFVEDVLDIACDGLDLDGDEDDGEDQVADRSPRPFRRVPQPRQYCLEEEHCGDNGRCLCGGEAACSDIQRCCDTAVGLACLQVVGDENNCGACGVQCNTGEKCCTGVCEVRPMNSECNLMET